MVCRGCQRNLIADSPKAVLKDGSIIGTKRHNNHMLLKEKILIIIKVPSKVPPPFTPKENFLKPHNCCFFTKGLTLFG